MSCCCNPTGAPSSGAAQKFIQSQTSGDNSVAPGASGAVNLTLFVFGTDPVDLQTQPQLLVTGILFIQGAAGEETIGLYSGTYFYEVSYDNGATWLASPASTPLPWTALTDANGLVTANLSLPILTQLSGAADITANMLWRATVTNDAASTGSVFVQAFIGYQISQPYPP